MRILIDMDDICVELLDRWTYHLNQLSDYHRETEDLVNWDMKLAYPDIKPESLYSMLSWPSFWKNVQPVKNAYKYLKLLIEDGHEIYIATASMPSQLGIKTENCLFRIFDYLSPKQVISIHDKFLLDADILFDDYHENLRKFKGIKVLRDAPYNRNCDEECYHFRVSRHNCWEEFYSLVKQIDNVRSVY